MTRPMPGPPQWYESSSLGDWDDAGQWRNRWDLHWEDGRTEFDVLERHDKRLTDVECAAEYWRARADFWANESLCLGGWFGWADGAEEVEDPPLYDVDRWYDVTHRFATHPHALEEA